MFVLWDFDSRTPFDRRIQHYTEEVLFWYPICFSCCRCSEVHVDVADDNVVCLPLEYNTHTHMYTHTHTHVHTYTHIDTRTYTRTHMYTHTRTRTHTYTHTQIHTYTHTHTRTHIYTHRHTYTHTHTHVHMYTHTRTRTHIHTHAHTCTHTNIQTEPVKIVCDDFQIAVLMKWVKCTKSVKIKVKLSPYRPGQVHRGPGLWGSQNF